jgi:hypothetical protein
MRISLNIADELIHEILHLTGQKAKTGAVISVMEDYVKRRRAENLLALRGKINIDYDWEQEEAAEMILDRQFAQTPALTRTRDKS